GERDEREWVSTRVSPDVSQAFQEPAGRGSKLPVEGHDRARGCHTGAGLLQPAPGSAAGRACGRLLCNRLTAHWRVGDGPPLIDLPPTRCASARTCCVRPS